MMKTHPHGEQISAYLDGMLDVAQMRAIAAHLRACAACQSSYESLQSTKMLLRKSPAPGLPSPDFWTDTYRLLRTDGEKRQAISPLNVLRDIWNIHLHGTQRRMAAGAAAIVALGGMIAAPLLTPRTAAVGPSVAVTEDALNTLDVSSLVQAHTDSAARQPLSDADRQTLLSADAEYGSQTDDAHAETIANADGAP